MEWNERTVLIEDYDTAKSVAVSYVLEVMRLQDFELRIYRRLACTALKP